MSKRLSVTAIAVFASALVALSAAPVVAAAATWTVTPGGVFNTLGTAHHSHLTDTSTGTAFLCQGLAIDGAFQSGSGLTNPIGKITVAHGPGSGPFLCGSSPPFGVTFSHFPMRIRAVSYDPSTGTT